MTNRLCRELDLEFPLFAFSHCRDVVAAVSRAGGFGVLGAVILTPEELDRELAWIDAHVGGRPYGVDLIVPNRIDPQAASLPDEALLDLLPDSHKGFAEQVLRRHGLDPGDLDAYRRRQLAIRRNLTEDGARESLEVAFSHPIRLIANALGVPPRMMLEMGRAHGVKVAALVGAKEHALAQAAAGVDIIIAAGTEAGGHCGEVTTMVLVPEVVGALEEAGADLPVLAAGGIATGRQMAAAMAMGAAGAWCGSVWLTTAEAETHPVVKEKMLRATSRDTVRARSRTGKPSRQLRSAWTDAWEAPDAPAPLPMPLQSLVAEPAIARINDLAGREPAAAELATYWVGQAVGLMNAPTSAAQVVQDFKSDFLAAVERLNAFVEG